jgi:hypothetical protein
VKFLVIIICCFISLYCAAQSIRYPIAAPYTTLSAYSTKQVDAFSFTGNQAALAKAQTATIGLYAEKRFLLANLNAYTLAAAIPTSLGNFAAQINYGGITNFNENKFGLAYARSLGSKVDVGLQFNYYSYRIPTYGSASSIYAEAGAVAHVTEKVNVGLHVYNPMGAKLGKQADEKLATAYKFGLGYDASDNFFVSGEIIKEEDKAINIQAGFQYQFAKQFFARAGFLSESSTVYAGAGVSFSSFRVDVAGSYHPQLGLSPALLLIVNFKKATSTTNENDGVNIY